MSPALQKAVDDAKQAISAFKDAKGSHDRALAEWHALDHTPPKPGDDPSAFLSRAIARQRASDRFTAAASMKRSVESEARRLIGAAHKAFAEEAGLPLDF